MWLGSDDHKEALSVDLLPFSPWRTRSVCGFTGHCSFFWQQGHYPFTTDLLAAPFCAESVLVPSAAAVYKDFTAPGLGVVEVPHLLLMTGTRECWVQADARARRCWNGRGNGSITRWSSQLGTRSTTGITSLFFNRECSGCGGSPNWKAHLETSFGDRIINVAEHDVI